MIQKENVVELVEEWVENTPFFLVDVRVNVENEVFVEFESETECVTIDDCVELSRFIESKLDREKEDFALEVGSAGVGQPFKVLKQYQIHRGKEVEVLTKAGTKCTGVLKEADEAGFSILVVRKVKTENNKRALKMEVEECYRHEDVKSVRLLLRFS